MTQKLSERVEALSGPDRMIDAEIATASGLYVYEKRDKDRKAWFYPTDGSSYRKGIDCPYSPLARYTRSIDAAMTLVPEGWLTERATQDFDGAEWHWSLYPAFKHAFRVWGQAGAAALALTAAALRARGL